MTGRGRLSSTTLLTPAEQSDPTWRRAARVKVAGSVLILMLLVVGVVVAWV